MTLSTKPVWIVVFESSKGNKHTQKIAARSFTEVLSYYNEKGVSEIVKVEKTEDNVTFQY
jgi:hypothetical protein